MSTGFPELNDDHIDPDAYDEAPTTETTPGAPARKRSTRSSGLSRAVVRRVALKMDEIIKADSEVVETLASILGTTSDPVSLTCAIMAGPRGDVNPLDEIARLREIDPLDAVVEVVMLERPAIKAVWNVLAEVTSLNKNSLPPSDPKAAPAIVQAIRGLDSNADRLLMQARDLMQKG